MPSYLIEVEITMRGFIGINGADNKHHAIATADARMKYVKDPFDLMAMLTEDPEVTRSIGVRATDVEDV